MVTLVLHGQTLPHKDLAVGDYGNAVSEPPYALWFAAAPFSDWQAVSDYHIPRPDNEPTAADVGGLRSNRLTRHKDGGIVRIGKNGAHHSYKVNEKFSQW